MKAFSINYDQNTFTISYNALSFPNTEVWNYDYYLQGYDLDWNLNEKNRSVTYRNLPHGTYEFRIRSTKPFLETLKGKLNR